MSGYIPSTSYNPAFPLEWEGLCLESAEAATPHWYGVSYGNGNDGVSHSFPRFYVRTYDPFTLAAAAMLSEFKPEGWQWAADNMEVDGEAEYTISAVIYDPPAEAEERDHSECEDGEDCEGCEACEPDEMDSWSSVNGAWMICEVFPVDAPEPDTYRIDYTNLDEAFTPDLLELARAI